MKLFLGLSNCNGFPVYTVPGTGGEVGAENEIGRVRDVRSVRLRDNQVVYSVVDRT